MKANAVVPISGTYNAWKVAAPSDPTSSVQERAVALEIQGVAKKGYHLIMSPSGCFTADSWHETIEEAMDSALRVFDVRPEEWK